MHAAEDSGAPTLYLFGKTFAYIYKIIYTDFI